MKDSFANLYSIIVRVNCEMDKKPLCSERLLAFHCMNSLNACEPSKSTQG